MATISFDAVTDGGQSAGVTSKTFAHTVGSGASRILFVACGRTATDNITGVKYNNVSMTQVIKQQATTGGLWWYIYVLYAPASGSNNVVISAGSSDVIAGMAISYAGAKQSGVPDASQSLVDQNSGNISATVTTVANNCWTLVTGSGGGSNVIGTGGTPRVDHNNGAEDNFCLGDHGPVTPAGSNTIHVTNDTTAMGTLMISFAPDVPASGFLGFL